MAATLVLLGLCSCWGLEPVGHRMDMLADPLDGNTLYNMYM